VIHEVRCHREWPNGDRFAIAQKAGRDYVEHARVERGLAQDPHGRLADIDRDRGVRTIHKPVVVRVPVRDNESED
jgi:hypothetical protein